MTYILRKPAEQDIFRIVELDRLVADHHHDIDGYWKKGSDIGNTTDIAEMVRQGMLSPDESWLVAEVDGEVVGFFSAKIRQTSPIFENKEIGFISDAYLLEASRGQGIAKTAILRFIEWFRERRVKSVELMVASDNVEGTRAWEGVGFKEYMKKMKMDL